MSKFSRALYWIFMLGLLALSAASFYQLFSTSNRLLPDPSELTELRGHLKSAERTNMKITDDGFWVDFAVVEFPNYRFRWESLDRHGSQEFANEPSGTPLTFSVLKNSIPPKRESAVINVIYLATQQARYMDPEKYVRSDRWSSAVTGIITLVLLVLSWAGYRNSL